MKKHNRRTIKKDERIWVRIPWYARALILWAVGSAIGMVLFYAVDASAAWRCSQLADQAAEFVDFYLSECDSQMCESVGEVVQARYSEEMLKEMEESRRGESEAPADKAQEIPEWYTFQQYLRHKDMAYVELRDALKVICACESAGRPDVAPRHYIDENNTQVLRGHITPQDIGMCQISEKYWGDKADELGLDLFDPHDNVAMANYIYDNYGAQPWYPSKKCHGLE